MPLADNKTEEMCKNCGLHCSPIEIPLCSKLIEAGLQSKKEAKEELEKLYFTPKMAK